MDTSDKEVSEIKVFVIRNFHPLKYGGKLTKDKNAICRHYLLTNIVPKTSYCRNSRASCFNRLCETSVS
jgi:hypothetical protein